MTQNQFISFSINKPIYVAKDRSGRYGVLHLCHFHFSFQKSFVGPALKKSGQCDPDTPAKYPACPDTRSKGSYLLPPLAAQCRVVQVVISCGLSLLRLTATSVRPMWSRKGCVYCGLCRSWPPMCASLVRTAAVVKGACEQGTHLGFTRLTDTFAAVLSACMRLVRGKAR